MQTTQLRHGVQSSCLRKAGAYLMSAALLAALSGCVPDRPQPTAPTLNLITGCFESMNGFGEPYLYVGCLTKPELDSLNGHQPGGFVTDNVAKFKADYARSVRQGASNARQPVLNLVTGCFEGQNRILLGLDKQCPVGFDPFQEKFFSPGVTRKIGIVMEAYFQQGLADLEVSRPRHFAPIDYTYHPVLIL
jgi:hypothetical protein